MVRAGICMFAGVLAVWFGADMVKESYVGENRRQVAVEANEQLLAGLFNTIGFLAGLVIIIIGVVLFSISLRALRS